MACPVCQQRKARRACPALSQTICSVCCATKRLVEINCPAECPHLAAAREHPAAAVKRQQERDVAVLLPTIQHLTERQHQLLFLFLTLIAGHVPDGLVRLQDDDVAEAAGATASTLETASRGVIYEHTTPSPVAQRLAREMTGMLAGMREQGAQVFDGEAAITLRALEAGARQARTWAGDANPTAYLTLVGRLLQVNRAAKAGPADVPPPARSIILPP
jgi:hypothetical protein